MEYSGRAWEGGEINLGVDKFIVNVLGAHIGWRMRGGGSDSLDRRTERGAAWRCVMDVRMESMPTWASGDPGRCGLRCGVMESGLRRGGGCWLALSVGRDVVLLKECGEGCRKSGIV